MFKKMHGNFAKGVNNGFTLIELMIVIVIVSILATIALPSYRDYVTRSRIVDATSALASKRASVEQFYDNYRYYKDSSKTPTQAPACDSDTTSSATFTYSCTAANATTYTISAVGNAGGPMNGFTFTIDQSNTRQTTSVPTGWTLPSTNCWVTRKDGSC